MATRIGSGSAVPPGCAAIRPRRFRGGRSTFAASIPLHAAAGDTLDEAVDTTNRGVAIAALGDADGAYELYRRALDLARASGDCRAVEGRLLAQLGKIERDRGHADVAMERLQQALPLLQASGERAATAGALLLVGELQLEAGESEPALQTFLQSQAEYRAVQDVAGEGTAATAEGRALEKLEHRPEAIARYDAAVALCRKADDRDCLRSALSRSGSAKRGAGAPPPCVSSTRRSACIVPARSHRAGPRPVDARTGA